jgi:uncharacterized membrane protein
MHSLPALLAGTVLLRPYVFVFLAVYIAAGCTHTGWKRTLLFIPLGYFLAWLSEFSSVHWGFPYGDYYYIPETFGRELWVFGVPFMDSLSYVFLSYCSYSLAVFLLSPVLAASGNLVVLETRRIRRSWKTLILGAVLFVLLDVVIDPVALLGDRWFLGKIYGYRDPGFYFGIPLSNFAGWLLVGFVLVGAFQFLERFASLDPQSGRAAWPPLARMLGPVLYFSILVFNICVTFWIGEPLLGFVDCLIAGCLAAGALFSTLYKTHRGSPELVERHLQDFPQSAAARLLPAGDPALLRNPA